MEISRKFKDINKNDVAIAGGKGASLGEMTQAGIPIPPGFVVLSNSFEQFIQENDLNIEIDSILDTVNPEEIHTVEDASEKIQSLIINSKMPENIEKEITTEFNELNSEFVAVRSSATSEDSASAAWAGQLDTFLNTTQTNLLENVKKCWASLFTPRAIFYRFEKNLQKEKVSVAVVVQKMVESEESGIAFSVHPVTEDPNQLIIEAGLGLGEAIVSGTVTPDSYVIDKQDWHEIDININEQTKALYRKKDQKEGEEQGGNEWKELSEQEANKQVLTNEEITELAKLIKNIEDHYKFPVDVEWAKEKGKLYITQSRPITTLRGIEPAETSEAEPAEEGKKKPNLKKSDNYVFHITISGLNILFLDLIFNRKNGYGDVDYRLLYENDISLFYLTKKGFKECYDLSKNLLDDDFTEELLKDSVELNKFYKTYKTPKLTNKNISKEWEKYLKYSDEFMRLYRYYEQPFQQALEEAILKEISEEELLNYFTNKKVNKDKNVSKEVLKNIKRIFELGEMKLQLHKNSESFFTSGSESFIKFVADKNNFSIEDVSSLRVNEFSDLLNEKSVDFNLTKKRLDGCVYVKRENRWDIDTGDDYLKLKEEIIGSQEKEIKGVTAFPGKVRGKVVSHLSWTDTTDIEEGDILVTGMTNPQMIPHIKKATAIITDEGGITCHAAIISREMKKPCITGAKVATQMLKDGDMVEVDADKGVVRILK